MFSIFLVNCFSLSAMGSWSQAINRVPTYHQVFRNNYYKRTEINITAMELKPASLKRSPTQAKHWQTSAVQQVQCNKCRITLYDCNYNSTLSYTVCLAKNKNNYTLKLPRQQAQYIHNTHTCTRMTVMMYNICSLLVRTQSSLRPSFD